jgi:hypothetical protein
VGTALFTINKGPKGIKSKAPELRQWENPGEKDR